MFILQHTHEIKCLVLKTFKLCLKYFFVENISKNGCKIYSLIFKEYKLQVCENKAPKINFTLYESMKQTI
jgi:hypothetical protein